MNTQDYVTLELAVRAAWESSQRRALEAITAKARRFNLDKNEVVGAIYMKLGGAEEDATAVERLLCDICNAFLDDICPDWRKPGDIAEPGYVPVETAKSVGSASVSGGTRPDDPHDSKTACRVCLGDGFIRIAGVSATCPRCQGSGRELADLAGIDRSAGGGHGVTP